MPWSPDIQEHQVLQILQVLIAGHLAELAGGIIFTVLGAVASPFVYSLNFQRNHSAGSSFMAVLIVTLPFIIVGILFIGSHYLKKREGAVWQKSLLELRHLVWLVPSDCR